MNSPALFSNSYHPHLDMDDQMFAVDSHKGKLHNEWVQNHANKSQMDHACSRVKALILVKEAERLELIHLQHQRDHANYLIQRCCSKKHGKTGSACASCFSPSRHTPSISPARNNQDEVAQSPDANNFISPSASDDCLDSKGSTTITLAAALAVAASANVDAASSPAISPSRRVAQQSFQATPAVSPAKNSHNMKTTKDLPSTSTTTAIAGTGKASSTARSGSCPPPPKPIACGCLHVAAWRLMTPRCRVMALLKKHGEQGNLEHIVDALRQTYTSDGEMIEDMDARYGPEPTALDAELLLQSTIERMEGHQARWRTIREDVDFEMSTSPHAFQNVIRTLSVMRIFIEGSQGQSYGIDFTDRQRREAAQHAVLSKLRANRALFIDQCVSPSAKKPNATTTTTSAATTTTTTATSATTAKFAATSRSSSSSSSSGNNNNADAPRKFTFNKAR